MANSADGPDECVRVGTWNVQWATPRSKRAPLVADMLAAPDCDILCVTEGDAGILPKGGHVIDAGSDWGYPLPKASPGRRKVLLWSRWPWTPVFDALQDALPGGRLVVGVTETPVGKVTVVGVCVPWGGAHVNTGRRDRVQWQDHLDWLGGFERLSYARPRRRTVVLGDFNQRSPRGGKLHSSLQNAFARFQIATTGFVAEASTRLGANGVELSEVTLADAPSAHGKAQLIDHIAHSQDLVLRQRTPQRDGTRQVGIFPKEIDGTRLSDHTGVWFDLMLRPAGIASKSRLRT